MIKYPDYDNSILSVISSILKYYGYDNGHNVQELRQETFAMRCESLLLYDFGWRIIMSTFVVGGRKMAISFL